MPILWKFFGFFFFLVTSSLALPPLHPHPPTSSYKKKKRKKTIKSSSLTYVINYVFYCDLCFQVSIDVAGCLKRIALESDTILVVETLKADSFLRKLKFAIDPSSLAEECFSKRRLATPAGFDKELVSANQGGSWRCDLLTNLTEYLYGSDWVHCHWPGTS